MVLVNLYGDVRRDYFNNLLEVGPGYRVGLKQFNRLNVYVAAVRGVYTTQGSRSQNAGRPNYLDVRVVVWYSKSF